MNNPQYTYITETGWWVSPYKHIHLYALDSRHIQVITRELDRDAPRMFGARWSEDMEVIPVAAIMSGKHERHSADWLQLLKLLLEKDEISVVEISTDANPIQLGPTMQKIPGVTGDRPL